VVKRAFLIFPKHERERERERGVSGLETNKNTKKNEIRIEN
jgi:hypothetical protein